MKIKLCPKTVKKAFIIILPVLLYGITIIHILYPVGYPEPGPETGNIKGTVLIYCGKGRYWEPSDFVPYISYVTNISEGYKPIRGFFDGFLFLAIRAPSGALFVSGSSEYGYAVYDDYISIVNKLVDPDNGLIANLSKAAVEVSKILNVTVIPRIIIFIPYPHPETTGFGMPLGDRIINTLDTIEKRNAAVRNYISTFLDGFMRLNVSVELAGFYWMEESIGAVDSRLVTGVNRYIHGLGYNSFWIPYYFASGFNSWQSMEFDCVCLQPNYFFYFWAFPTRVADAAKRAAAVGAGVELELDDNILINKADYLPRFMAYYEAAVRYGFSKGYIAVYQGVNTLAKLSRSNDTDLRGVYDLIYKIVTDSF